MWLILLHDSHSARDGAVEEHDRLEVWTGNLEEPMSLAEGVEGFYETVTGDTELIFEGGGEITVQLDRVVQASVESGGGD